MGVVFFLGFFLDWIEITLIVLPVFAPLVINLDFGDHVAKQTCLLVHHPDGGQSADRRFSRRRSASRCSI